MPPPPEYFMPHESVAAHGQRLPHWEQGAVYQFITWRLADAIPQSKLSQIAEHRKAWLTHHPPPWNEDEEREYHTAFSGVVDTWLDAGTGACILREPQFRQIVTEALHFFDHDRYVLDSFVVMPNHVHVVLQPMSGHPVADVVKSWKGFTSREINRLRGTQGPLWQERYWDRLLRSPLHHVMCREYIRLNPAKAHLREGEYAWWERPFVAKEPIMEGRR